MKFIEPVIESNGTKYIPFEDDLIRDIEYFEQIKQEDGSILLKPYHVVELHGDSNRK
jgi:hypothetical protein